MELCFVGLVVSIALFQFQLGTIGTHLSTRSKGAKKISIPVRYDWNISPSVLPFISIKFQFQLGTIGTPWRYFNDTDDDISIPVRYDWNAVMSFALNSLTHFNSS